MMNGHAGVGRRPDPNGPHAIAALLAAARRSRRVSQMALAGEAGVSARHLSFVETGRARPSRDLLLRLCEALLLPPRDADRLLLAAGFAPVHQETPLEAPAMAEVLAALRLLLGRHDPLPAVAFDANWDVVMTNGAHAGVVDACLAAGADLAAGPGPVARLALLPPPRPNLLRLLCHPAGARRLIANWEEVARALLHRARREMPHAATSSVPARRPILDEVLDYPGVARLLRPGHEETGAPPTPLLVPVEVLGPDGGRTRFLTTIATLGTAQDLTVRELRIETYHPV